MCATPAAVASPQPLFLLGQLPAPRGQRGPLRSRLAKHLQGAGAQAGPLGPLLSCSHALASVGRRGRRFAGRQQCKCRLPVPRLITVLPLLCPARAPSRHPPSQSLPHSGTPPWQSCRCRCQGAGLYTDAQGGAARVSRGGAGTHTPTTHQPLQAPHLHASHRPTLEGLIIKGLLSRLDSGLRGRCGHRRGARHAAPRLGCSSSSGAEHERCAERARAQHMQTVHRSSSPRTRISQIGGLLGSALLLLLLLRQRVGQAAAARAAARKGSC